MVDDFVPSLLLDAKWSSENRASLGNTLKPGKLQDAPSIFLGGHRSHQVDTVVILTDPDAPSRKDPKWAEVCHWIARSHVPPSAQTDGEFDESAPSHSLGLEDIMPYKPPGPPEGTGKHRYVFLALVPRNGTTERLHPTKPGDRKHWGYDSDDGETRGVREWARENGLVPVGRSRGLDALAGGTVHCSLPIRSPGSCVLTNPRFAAANFLYAKH